MKKLNLKPLTRKHAKDYAKIACDTSIHSFVPFMECSNEAEAIEFISKTKKYYTNDKLLGIFCGKLLVGAILTSFFEGELTIHIFIGKAYRNNGIASRAICELIKIIRKNNQTVQKLIMEIKDTNLSSLTLQKNIGFKELRKTNNYFIYVYNI